MSKLECCGGNPSSGHASWCETRESVSYPAGNGTMTDAERIALVERLRLDVWYHDTVTHIPAGWVVDMGDADKSLWDARHTDGGTTLAVGMPSWRSAVDAAVDVLDAMGRR